MSANPFNASSTRSGATLLDSIIARLALVSIALLGLAPVARAEPFRLAVAAEHGAYLPRSYAFDALLQPGFDIGRLRLAASGGVVFRNPDFAPSIGVRPSLVLWAPATPSTGLRLICDFSYLPTDSWRASGGLALDLESVQLGVLAGYDSFHGGALLVTTLAIDIPTIWRFLAAAPFASAPSCAAPR